jgi:hypothetical protein
LLVETDASLDSLLFGLLNLLVFVEVRFLFLDEPIQGLTCERSPVLEIAASDLFTLRVCREPPLAVAQQFLDLVFADPVVLRVVEHGDEDIKVGQQIAQPATLAKRDAEVGALAPVREPGVERMGFRIDFVAQRFEECSEKELTTSRGKGGDVRLQGQWRVDEVRSLLGTTPECRSIYPRDRDAKERRRRIGAVVDVLVERAGSSPPDEAHGIDVEEQGSRAPAGRSLRIEHVSFPKGQLELLRPGRVLMEQIPEVGRRRLLVGDGQEHLSNIGGKQTLQHPRWNDSRGGRRDGSRLWNSRVSARSMNF